MGEEKEDGGGNKHLRAPQARIIFRDFSKTRRRLREKKPASGTREESSRASSSSFFPSFFSSPSFSLSLLSFVPANFDDSTKQSSRDRHITKSTWLRTRREKKRKRTRYFVILIDLPIRGTEDTHDWLIIKVIRG